MIRQEFKEFDENKKDKDWFRRILVDIQPNKQWIISKQEYAINKAFADGCYDVSESKKKYDAFNRSDLFIDFTPLDIFGTRLRSIQSIIEKQGFDVNAKCKDLAAHSKKEDDIELLKAEKALLPIRQQMASAIGLQKPLPISEPSDFSSDTSPIQKMNLDISNPVDEGLYKDFFQRQIWEIAIELGIAHYLSLSEYMEILKMWTADMINNNCFAGQVITNSYSGEPEVKSLYPFDVYTILGKRPDRKDALAKGWEKIITVRELIALMASEITEDDLNQVLQLANQTSGTHYASIWFPEHSNLGECPKDCCTYGTFLNMTCALGYMEIKSQNSDLYVNQLSDGNVLTEKKELSYNLPKNVHLVDSTSDLKKESDRNLEYAFYDVTYKGFYIPFSNFVFGFGKLPLATRYGSKNELTDFSIITYKLEGQSMNRKCQPFIKHISDLWYKYHFFINESRPSGEKWDIDTVREISKEIIGIDGQTGKIMDTLKILQNSVNTVYKTRTIDGVQTGGDADPVKERIRGLDPSIEYIVKYMAYDLQQIEQITGVNSVLLAQTPTAEQGLGVSQIYLQQSINTIYYIQSAIQKAFSDVSFDLCQKVQLIVNGDVSTEAYKSIEKAIGTVNVEALQALGDEPPYSFDIFVQFGMNELQKQEIKQITDLMIQQKIITAAQAMQVKECGNYKIATALLTYYESKALQQQQQAQQVTMQIAMEQEQQKHQNKMDELSLEKETSNSTADITGQWNYKIELLKITGKDQLQDKKEISKHIAMDTRHQQTQSNMVLDSALNPPEQPEQPAAP